MHSDLVVNVCNVHDVVNIKTKVVCHDTTDDIKGNIGSKPLCQRSNRIVRAAEIPCMPHMRCIVDCWAAVVPCHVGSFARYEHILSDLVKTSLFCMQLGRPTFDLVQLLNMRSSDSLHSGRVHSHALLLSVEFAMITIVPSSLFTCDANLGKGCSLLKIVLKTKIVFALGQFLASKQCRRKLEFCKYIATFPDL